jgi:hypothetical protein
MIWSVMILYFVSLACVLFNLLMPRVLLHRFPLTRGSKASRFLGDRQSTSDTCMPFYAVDAVKNCTEHRRRHAILWLAGLLVLHGRRSSNQGTGMPTSRLDKAPSAARGPGRRSRTVSRGSICRDRWPALDEEGFCRTLMVRLGG